MSQSSSPDHSEQAQMPQPTGVAPSSETDSVVTYFCGSAARYPDTVAVRWADGRLTYRELRAHAGALAARLKGVQLAAVYGERSAELTIAIVATLLAGAGYVPLDPSYPRQRLNYMLADCRPDVLLCLHKDAGALELPDGCRVVAIDDALSADLGAIAAAPAVPQTGTCYVMYTSGSTGQPKGIVMPHSVPGNLIRFESTRSAATVGWNTLQFAPISFDVSVQEMFTTWSTGGTLILIDDETRCDPRDLLSYLVSQQVHRIFLPCVALQMLAEAAASRGRYPASLREVCTAGEQLRITPAIREFFRRTRASLANHYGPTETHVATTERLPADPGQWPALPAIGRAIDGAVVYVLDAGMQPLPAGDPGEIWIGGILADGYLGRPELTEDRFKVTADGTRVYRTGDIGRMLDDGRLEWIGRQDDQLKIRGFRVETGEIEVRLRAIDGIVDAVVIAESPDDPERMHLVAYCVRQPGVPVPGSAAVLESLAAELPHFMMPARCVLLDEFPVTPNGKVDREALRVASGPGDHEASQTSSSDPGPPLTDAEAVIAGIYADLLGVTKLTAETSFFGLGGNSLGLARLATRLEEAFGPRVPVFELFTHNSVAAQAALLERLFAAELDEYPQDDVMAVLDQMQGN
jgi:amino acid adenylation domain-containing protein